MDLDLTGLRSKTMYNVLRVREEGEIVRSRKKKSAEVDSSEEFEYESDDYDGYSYGQPCHHIASLLIFMLRRSETHHENCLDELVQDMQGNK